MSWFLSLAPSLQSVLVLGLGALALLAAAKPLTAFPRAAPLLGAALAVAAALPALAGGPEALAVLSVCALAAIALLLLPSAALEFAEHRLDSSGLLLLGAAGGVVLATANDLLSLVLGLETLSLATAVLTGLGRGRRPIEAAFKFFVLAAVGLAAMVYGIGLYGYASGTFALGATPSPELQPLWTVAGVLLVLGILFELAVVPLHFGALGAYMTAPPAVAAFATTASKLAAGFALLRLAPSLEPKTTGALLLTAGLASIVWATFAALAQRDLRGLLAYSAVAHAGFTALALGCGEAGRQAAVFYLVVYAASSALAFGALAGVDGPLPLASLRDRPLSPGRTLALVLALLSLAGVPPAPGLWAKLAVLVPVWQVAGPLVTALAAAGGVFGALYYLRPVPDLLASIRTRPDTAKPGERQPVSAGVALAIAAAAVTAFTVLPWLGTALLRPN